MVGVFPNPEALLRLAGAVLVEAHDECQATDRRYLAEATMALLTTPTPSQEGVVTPELMTASSEPQSLTRTELHHSAGRDRAGLTGLCAAGSAVSVSTNPPDRFWHPLNACTGVEGGRCAEHRRFPVSLSAGVSSFSVGLDDRLRDATAVAHGVAVRACPFPDRTRSRRG